MIKKSLWVITLLLGLCSNITSAMDGEEKEGDRPAGVGRALPADVHAVGFPESEEDLLRFLQSTTNVAVRNFMSDFSERLCEANQARISHAAIEDRGASAEGPRVVRLERRLDAVARLLEGDEVCAAVSFDGEKLYVSTNEPYHSCDLFDCPLWDRIHFLHGHLTMISRLSHEAGTPIHRHEWLKTTRNQFVRVALLYKLLKNKTSGGFDLFNLLKDSPLTPGRLSPLQRFVEFMSDDFCSFEEDASPDADSDVVEQWIDARREEISTRFKEFKAFNRDLPKELRKKLWAFQNPNDGFFRVVMRFFRDLVKVEEYFSVVDFPEDSMSEKLTGIFSKPSSPWVLVDDGGEGVHAEMRVFEHFATADRPCEYIGISKLCCPHCYLVMSDNAIVKHFVSDDVETDEGTLVRGGHAKPYPWPVHTELKDNRYFLNALFGEVLLERLSKMSPLQQAQVWHYVHIAPRLSFEHSAAALELGIRFPTGDGRFQLPDSSVAFSKTHSAFFRRKAFFLFDSKKVVEDGTKEFERLQALTRGSRRAFLFNIEEFEENLDSWYTDRHMRYALEHSLPAAENFTVVDPATTVFERRDTFEASIRNAIGQAVDGQTVVMPIHLHGNHWVGAVFRRQADGSVQVIYNNPQGYRIDLEPNAVWFVQTVQDVTREITGGHDPSIVDLHFRQQENFMDCGPFSVDNLIRIARAGVRLDGQDRAGILEQVALQNQVNAPVLRRAHEEVFEAGADIEPVEMPSL